MNNNECNSLDSLDIYLAQSNNHIDSELNIESNLISIGENIETNEKVLKESKKNELKNNNINYERNSDYDLKHKMSFTDICKIGYNTINEEDLQIIIENGSLTQKFPKTSSSKKDSTIQKGKQLTSKKRGRKKKRNNS